MRIPVDQITATAKEVVYAEAVEGLNERLALGDSGLRAGEALAVRLRHYRAGEDIVVEGQVGGEVRASCDRCLTDYPLAVDVPFRVILEPTDDDEAAEGDALREDLGIGVVRGDVVDVTALVHEHLLLAVPTSRLCDPACRGLCPACGANRNEAACTCEQSARPRPRMAVLHDLLRGRATHE